MIKNKQISKIFFAMLWLFIAIVSMFLLFAAIYKKDGKLCKRIEVKINGITNKNEQRFVDESDVLNIVQTICNQNPVGKTIGSFNLNKIEAAIEKSTWVKNAELFFDNNQVLIINIQEREPIARIFSKTNYSFYIDSTLTILPINNKLSARVPVFTSFSSDKKVLSVADSNLLIDIKSISLALQNDSFMLAMIEQINILSQSNFEMIPKIGNQIILFGNANNIQEKFLKLRLFFKNILPYTGWDKYSEINLQYKNQLVAKRKGADDKIADSVRTLQLMQLIADNASKQSEDSTQLFSQDNTINSGDSSIVEQSVQREDDGDSVNENMVDKIVPTLTTPHIVKPTNIQRLPIKKINTIKKSTSKPLVLKASVPVKKIVHPVLSKPIKVLKPIIGKKNVVLKSTTKTPSIKPKIAKPKPKLNQIKNEY